MERALMCPQCNAPLKPSRFARSVICSYCGATVQLDPSSISAARFHETFRQWNSPPTYGYSSWISLGESHWALNEHIASGERSDVFTAQRARRPSELAIVKLLRDQRDRDVFDNEWNSLQTLHRSDTPGADTFTMFIPQPVLHGDISDGLHKGSRVNIYRWKSGFFYTFEDVLQAYPNGIDPRASIWVWRRILEVLSFIHNSGMAHGAVIPPHLLVQENEHGILLVGYGNSGRSGGKIRTISERFETYYRSSDQVHSTLTPQLDIMMSARCVIYILGGDPETGSMPQQVPGHLAEFIKEKAFSKPGPAASVDAWAIREELGQMARDVFGASQFVPIRMP